MKLIVKNLKGKQFDLEIEPASTVRQVKEKIEEEQKIAIDTQKLVAVGKVMDDAKTVEDYKLKEGDFIVVMVSKPKKPKATPPPQPQPAATTTSSLNTGMNAPGATSTAPPTTSSQAPAPVPEPSASSSSAPGGDTGILRGEALENTLKEMQEMGFPREECMRALRAAFYNPERAVDYLLNGIPSDLQDTAQPAPSGVPPTGAGATGMGAGIGGDGGANPLGSLQNNPMFDQLRQRLISEPQFFQQFMSQLATTQPQLHQAISQNPQAFLQLLLGGAGGGAGGDMGPENDPPGTVRVTPEEKEAIERLAALGFPKHRAIEAYLACDKNEEWAANYLFENCMADDNYEQQIVQDESAAEAGVDPNIPPVQPQPVSQPASVEQPPAENPPVENPPVENPPAENPPAENPPAEVDMEVDPPAQPENADNANNAENAQPPANNEPAQNNDDEGEDSSL